MFNLAMDAIPIEALMVIKKEKPVRLAKSDRFLVK